MTYRHPVCALLILSMLAAAACAQQHAQAQAPAPPENKTLEKPARLTLDGLLANIEAARKKLAESKHKTFRAKVTKVHYVEVIDDTEKYAGTIEFRIPRLLRLSLTREGTDDETIAIVGGKYGWIYRPQKKQVERVTLPPVDQQKTSANPLEYGLARSIYGLREGYLLQMQAPEKAGDVEAIPLLLTPRDGDNYTAGKLVFWIDPGTWFPVQVRQYLSNNEIVDTYTFTNVEIDVNIEDSVFEFKKPRGVDLIDHDEE